MILLARRFLRTALDREAPHHVPAVGEKLAHEDDVAVVTGTRVGLLRERAGQPVYPFDHRPHAVEAGTLLPVATGDLRLGVGGGREGNARDSQQEEPAQSARDLAQEP